MNNHVMLSSLILLVATATVATAQPDEPFTFDSCFERFYPEQDKDREVAEREAQLPVAVAGVAPAATTSAAIVAGEKDGRGEISFSRKIESRKGLTGELTARLSAPFSKDSGGASLASLSGLNGDIVAGGSFTRSIWKLNPTDYAEKLCRTCVNMGLGFLDCSIDGISNSLKSNGRSAEEINAKVQELGGAIFEGLVTGLWGVEASVGRKERAFFDTRAAKKTEDREGYTFAIFGAWHFRENWSSFGRLTGKRDYKERGRVNLCSPVTGTLLEDCSSLPFGQADLRESLVASAELRRFFKSVAVAPSVQYDIEDSIWALEAPIYLVRERADGSGKGDARFTGGLKLSWRSDEDDLLASIFVGLPLRR